MRRHLTMASGVATALAACADIAQAACSVSSQAVQFGALDLSRQSFAEGAIDVLCDEPSSFTIAISPGGGGGPRRLRGPSSEAILYELYADPGYSAIWGDGVLWGVAIPGSSAGNGQVRFTIYGAAPPVPGGRPAGDYTDQLTVTLNF